MNVSVFPEGPATAWVGETPIVPVPSAPTCTEAHPDEGPVVGTGVPVGLNVLVNSPTWNWYTPVVDGAVAPSEPPPEPYVTVHVSPWFRLTPLAS